MVMQVVSVHGRWESLRTIRTRSGFSVRGLARAAGLAASSVSELENGLYLPSPSTTVKLARALQVPVAAIERRTP
jgi:HTH-type transcriptional repressor of puuD